MGIHSKSIYKKVRKSRGFYSKAQDDLILEEIKKVIKERPSYGYKRVTAIINKSRSTRINKKRVYVAFVLDTCDREVISYQASTHQIIQEDIQSLMISAVERRFNSLQAPRLIQFLSDRGAVYRAKDTIGLARSLNLTSCFTAAYSPESNGKKHWLKQ